MTGRTRKHWCRVGMLALFLVSLPLSYAMAAEQAAQVSFIRGDVLLKRPGVAEPVLLRRGDAVAVGDVIETASKGVVQLVFADRAVLYIPADSSVALESYHFEGVEAAEQGEAVIEVLKGSFRNITGILGRTRPESIRFKANDTNVGIRGTALEVALREGGFTEVIFDYGQGYVEANVGDVCLRAELNRGDRWYMEDGAVKTVRAKRGEKDPSRVARDIIETRADEIQPLTREFGRELPTEETLLALGMLQEFPFFDDKVLHNAVVGFSMASDDAERPRLISAVTMIYPDDGAVILEAALAADTPMVDAMSGVMCGLKGQSSTVTDRVISRAVELGITPEEAKQVLDGVSADACRI